MVFKCPGIDSDIDSDCAKIKHSWVSTTYTTATFCDDCGLLLHGVAHQGVKCDSKLIVAILYTFSPKNLITLPFKNL